MTLLATRVIWPSRALLGPNRTSPNRTGPVESVPVDLGPLESARVKSEESPRRKNRGSNCGGRQTAGLEAARTGVAAGCVGPRPVTPGSRRRPGFSFERAARGGGVGGSRSDRSDPTRDCGVD